VDIDLISADTKNFIAGNTGQSEYLENAAVVQALPGYPLEWEFVQVLELG
jgi:hypothetical protein